MSARGKHAAGHAPTQVANLPEVRKISARLALVGGLYRQESATTGAVWWSADGNDYHPTPQAARRAQRESVTLQIMRQA